MQIRKLFYFSLSVALSVVLGNDEERIRSAQVDGLLQELTTICAFVENPVHSPNYERKYREFHDQTVKIKNALNRIRDNLKRKISSSSGSSSRSTEILENKFNDLNSKYSKIKNLLSKLYDFLYLTFMNLGEYQDYFIQYHNAWRLTFIKNYEDRVTVHAALDAVQSVVRGKSIIDESRRSNFIAKWIPIVGREMAMIMVNQLEKDWAYILNLVVSNYSDLTAFFLTLHAKIMALYFAVDYVMSFITSTTESPTNFETVNYRNLTAYLLMFSQLESTPLIDKFMPLITISIGNSHTKEAVKQFGSSADEISSFFQRFHRNPESLVSANSKEHMPLGHNQVKTEICQLIPAEIKKELKLDLIGHLEFFLLDVTYSALKEDARLAKYEDHLSLTRTESKKILGTKLTELNQQLNKESMGVNVTAYIIRELVIERAKISQIHLQTVLNLHSCFLKEKLTISCGHEKFKNTLSDYFH